MKETLYLTNEQRKEWLNYLSRGAVEPERLEVEFDDGTTISLVPVAGKVMPLAERNGNPVDLRGVVNKGSFFKGIYLTSGATDYDVRVEVI